MSEYLQLLSFSPEGWGAALLSGAALTLQLALATLPLGLILGLTLALCMDSKRLLVSRSATVFVTIFRGLPELLTIFIIYYGVQLLVKEASESLGFKAFQVNGFFAGMLALGLVFGAFSSEVFLTAIRAIAKGQREAAFALGLSRIDMFRFVTAPQLWRIALPGLGNLWLVLLKETSLLSVIALTDLMRQTYLAVSNTKEPFFFYAVACAIYLLFSIISGQVLHLMEKRANRFYTRSGVMELELLSTYGPRMLAGLGMTLKIVLLSVALGAILSLPLAAARMSRIGWLRRLAFGYTYLFRGTPLLAQTFLVYYGAGQLRPELQSLGLWWFFRDAYWCTVLTFTLNTAAYQAEIWRGAIQAVPKGQWEVAHALGLSRMAGLKDVIVPQAFVVALRPLSNELILMLKSSAIASVIAVPELMGMTSLAFSRSFDFQVYLWAAVLYLTMVETIRRLCGWISARITRHITHGGWSDDPFIPYRRESEQRSGGANHGCRTAGRGKRCPGGQGGDRSARSGHAWTEEMVRGLRRAQRHRPGSTQRRAHRGLRAVRQRQVDVDPLHQWPGGVSGRKFDRQRHRDGCRWQWRGYGPQGDRHGLPGLPPLPSSFSLGKLHVGANARAEEDQGPGAGAGPGASGAGGYGGQGRSLPQPAIRWSAAARGDRSGAVHEPADHVARRTHLGTRPGDGQGSAGRGAGAGGKRYHPALRHPRDGLCPSGCGPGDLHGPRTDRRTGRTGRVLQGAEKRAGSAVPQPDPALIEGLAGTGRGVMQGQGIFSEDMIDQGKPKAAQVYQLLRAAIVGLALTPGDVLSEKDICEALGVSRTPVREAILRLVNEQMLVVRPNAGTYVSAIRLRDVLEGQLVRETLEARCVRLAARFFKPRYEDDFEALFLRKHKAYQRRECGEFYTLDEAFHRLICECAGYSHLWNVMQGAMGPLDRVRRLAFPVQLHFDEVIDEHREIYEAIRVHDEARAEGLMTSHVNSLFESLERLGREPGGLLIEGLAHDDRAGRWQLSERVR